MDKHHRHQQSHAIVSRIRADLQNIARQHQAKLKVVEVPPPVLTPIVAEIYAPDQQSQQQVAALLEAKFKKQAGMVDIDSSVVTQSHAKGYWLTKTKP